MNCNGLLVGLSMICVGSTHNTQRTVALAVGGFAALAFLIVCLLFVRSVMKKKGKHGG